MEKIEFDEYIKKHIYFTKIDDNTWFVQSKKESICQAYYVTVLPCAIVMYGDYDGVIVKPHECGKENLIHWMAGADCLSYFCEKVFNGNQHHQYKEFSQKNANESIVERILSRYSLYDVSDIKNIILESSYYEEIEDILEVKIARKLNCHVDNLEEEFNDENLLSGRKYSDFKDELRDYCHISIESDQDFFNFLNDREYYDIELCESQDYTHQIKWQHQCLLWWANNLIEKRDGVILDDLSKKDLNSSVPTK